MKSGIVILMSDFCDEWTEILKASKIDILGLHANPTFTNVTQYLDWINKKDVIEKINKLEDMGVRVEHYLHALDWLLPRNLFNVHPEYFRFVDGKRVVEHNLCVSSEGLDIVQANAYILAKKLNQSSHRYHIWADDGLHNSCHCEQCEKINHTDQIMLITNAIYKGISAYDGNAKVSYLCYADAVDIPAIKAEKGVFLEFAPFYRKFDLPLEKGDENSFYKNLLLNLLKQFNPHDSEILDYWLDVSLFSNWKKENVHKLAVDKTILKKDIAFYSDLGVYAIKSFAAFIDEDYLSKYDYEPITLFGKLVKSRE